MIQNPGKEKKIFGKIQVYREKKNFPKKKEFVGSHKYPQFNLYLFLLY